MSDVITADTQLDLEGEGLQPTEAQFIIVGTDVVENDNGQRWVVTFEATEEIPGLLGGTVDDGGYLSHKEREDLVQMGRGQLKRLGRSLLGRTAFALSELEGFVVTGTVMENDAGYTNIRRIKPVS